VISDVRPLITERSAPLTTEQYVSIVRRWVEEGWNQGNLGLVDELYAPDYVLHGNGTDTPGSDGFKQFVAGFRAAVPDLHVTIEDLFAAGDRVVWRFIFGGTQTAELMGIPSKGQSFRVGGIVVSRFEGDRWTEDHVVWDALGMLKQLGALPAAA
jgi:steroid delta-isomerase-like uncharacterized protein